MDALRSEFRREGRQIHTCTFCPFLIDTKMFRGVRIKFPMNWLVSPLKKEVVATRLLCAVESRESLVLLPWIMNFVPVYWLLPQWARDFFRDLIDERTYMDTFSGATKRS